MWLWIVYRDDSNFDKSSSCPLTIRINTDRMANRRISDSPNSEFANHHLHTILDCKFVVLRDDSQIVYSWLKRHFLSFGRWTFLKFSWAVATIFLHLYVLDVGVGRWPNVDKILIFSGRRKLKVKATYVLLRTCNTFKMFYEYRENEGIEKHFLRLSVREWTCEEENQKFELGQSRMKLWNRVKREPIKKGWNIAWWGSDLLYIPSLKKI